MTAQVVTLTETTRPHGVTKIVWDWLSTDAGVVTSKTARGYTGAIVRVSFKPDADTTQPSDAYDLTITDDDGFDVVNGTGANLSQTTTLTKVQSDGLAWIAETNLQLNITNAGNAKGGLVYLYIMEINSPS